MSNKPIFSEKEQIIGYLNITSGSLLLTDGIWDSNTIHKQDKTVIDLNEEKPLKIPVTTILQNGRRFILLDIDAATDLPIIDENVLVENESKNTTT